MYNKIYINTYELKVNAVKKYVEENRDVFLGEYDSASRDYEEHPVFAELFKKIRLINVEGITEKVGLYCMMNDESADWEPIVSVTGSLFPCGIRGTQVTIFMSPCFDYVWIEYRVNHKGCLKEYYYRAYLEVEYA